MAKPKGMQRLFVTMVSGIIVVLIVGFWYAFSYQRSLQRDAMRLDVIRQAEAAFQKVFLLYGGYQTIAKDGCSAHGVALSTCNFSSVSIDATSFRDPAKSSIHITKVPSKDGYEVTFTLERKRGLLAKGTHTLTQQGIR